jgi:hypothetical protein
VPIAAVKLNSGQAGPIAAVKLNSGQAGPIAAVIFNLVFLAFHYHEQITDVHHKVLKIMIKLFCGLAFRILCFPPPFNYV